MIKHFVVFLVIVCQLLFNIIENDNDGLMHLHMLDVGQGDAFLLQTVDKKYVLIDGGPSSNLIDVMADYMPFWQNRLDLVIATHGDSDHIGGLVELSERYDIEAFIYNGESKNTLIFEELMKNISFDGVDISIAQSGEEIRVGCCMEIDILWPGSINIEDSNDRSVSIIAKYQDFEIYMAGDLGYKYEEKITNNLGVDIEVMKISHHGSRTSTSTKVVDNIRPQITLISAGKDNKFGHPHREVLDLLDKNNIIQYRTDIQGTVSIKSDGSDYVVDIEKDNK
ncbi:MBL fold metallo-hydrolase [Candidatus Dojkabacteria bacterium]|uniref:MBL fold metallo-hydrolase n=1 Tax=Candidatus Dojkabacteria bacterium TaxID=2099670 RepID=A0A955L0U7_9BACT|nr:MBL fold metallo-hydrolase [Candidatus Dojkabacteria bacterium]